ncbi:MAG: pyridoxamine 5'-phosphate oxidase family protein [Pirellulales bacterium]|nr:pyridoxamine 5'-phosphate oxidase family protein [Pirellulales bacterium]
MKLDEYFTSVRGLGVLATADANGKVDVAVYSRPHFLGDGDEELAFIMNDHLSHENLQSNPHAAFLYVEGGGGYQGKRLFLTKIREDTDKELIAELSRRAMPECCEEECDKKQFLVHFRVDGVRPLIGDSE